MGTQRQTKLQEHLKASKPTLNRQSKSAAPLNRPALDGGIVSALETEIMPEAEILARLDVEKVELRERLAEARSVSLCILASAG